MVECFAWSVSPRPVHGFDTPAVSPHSNTQGGVVHGDATLDNLLLTPDQHIGIYDFDQSGPGWRAYELQGYCYCSWIDQRPSNWAALIDGYNAVFPLRATDLAAMPCFVVLNRLWCMGFEAHVIAQNHGRWIVDSTYFDERLAVLRRWAAAHPELSGETLL